MTDREDDLPGADVVGATTPPRRPTSQPGTSPPAPPIEPVAEGQPPAAEYIENEPTPERPVVKYDTEAATFQLRRWIIGGIGALLAVTIIYSVSVVLIRPELADFVKDFAQLVVGALIALGATAVGFLFGRNAD